MRRTRLTEKLSVSLKKEDVKLLRARAKRLYGGNLSALLSDLARLARYEDGADALVAWLGNAARPTEAEQAAFAAEREKPIAVPKTRRRRKAA